MCDASTPSIDAESIEIHDRVQMRRALPSDRAGRSRPHSTRPMLPLLLLLLLPATVRAWTAAPPSPRPRLGHRSRVVMREAACGLGFDFGTSGVRINVLDSALRGIVFEAAQPWPHPEAVKEANAWREALFGLLGQIPPEVRARVARVAVSGTSASCLVVGRTDGGVRRCVFLGGGWRAARLYNWDALRDAPEGVGTKAQALLQQHAPPRHTTLSGTSTLMKALAWQLERHFAADEVMVHQADYLAGCLMHDAAAGRPFPRTSDWNNMLKLGYDMERLCYPAWFEALGRDAGLAYTDVFPTKVVQPGEAMGLVSTTLVREMGLAPDCQVVGGTTDSIAAFIASGASERGQAVSSLGSTLAIKMLSATPVEDASRGVYSHRLGDLWLVGGASNVGCAVLREQDFSNEELAALSEGIDPQRDIDLDYYPLAGKSGERFPTCDPQKQAVLEPRPASRKEFLHGILQGIARVEREGYDILKELGADPLRQVLTAGGGSKNPTWTRMRERILGVPTARADETDAAYGAALLALKTLEQGRAQANEP